jgi:hypothetical protein
MVRGNGSRRNRKTPATPLLVHVDCDTYDATVEVLELCSNYAEHGLIIHFDDDFGFRMGEPPNSRR